MRLFVLILALFLPSLAMANFAIEARGSLVIPDDTRIRRMFHKMWGDYGIEISYVLYQLPWGQWEIFNDLNYTRIKGRSTFLKQPIHATVWSDHFGVKYALFCCEVFRLYAGLGIGAVSIRHTSHFDYLQKRLQGGSLVLKIGMINDFCDRLFIDFFVDYIHNWTRNSVQTGGLKIGLGLGVRF